MGRDGCQVFEQTRSFDPIRSVDKRLLKQADPATCTTTATSGRTC